MKTLTKLMLAATVAFSGLTASSSANASVIINIIESGASVVAAANGTFNSTGLSTSSTNSYGGFIQASAAVIKTGSGDFGYYSGLTRISGGTSFGNSDFRNATDASGIGFGVNGSGGLLYLALNYVSGTLITSTSTFGNSSFASLGLIQGSYVYQLNGDRITVNVGQTAAVPETATWGMMIAGFGMMGAAMRTRRRSTKVSFA